MGLLEQLYEEVLVAAFPRDELDEPWWTPQGSSRAPTLTIVALDRDDRVIGGVVGEWYEEERTLLIAYLAVRRNARRAGVGTKLMTAAATTWYPRLRPLLVLGELRDPRHHSTDDEYAEARVGFYDRLGAKALAVPYFQPRLRPTGQRVYHMLLSAFYIAPEASDQPDTVDARLVLAFLDRYIIECEGEVARANDPAVRWLRRLVVNEPLIRILALRRYREVPDPQPPGAP